MILAEKNTNSFTTSKAFETTDFGIKSENLKHLIDLISGDIYSNKPLAIVRETSCNAMDSHIASGKPTVPIRITLPSRFSQNFIVRDFGKGLTHDEMQDIYTSYGASTKRDSNTQVGAFGLGSKVAFCLYDSFNINSYQNGTKMSYTCVRDATNVGKLILVGSFHTKEKDGLEVVVSVNSDDVDNFCGEAKKFFKYWAVMPEIEGFVKSDYDEIIGTDKVFISGTGWKIIDQNSIRNNSYRYNNSGAVALMGNIAYPIQWASVKGFKEMLSRRKGAGGGYMEYFITENTIIFDFNIGEVKMAPSREALQYTELTNNSIIKRVETMLNEVAVNAQQKIDSVTNLWEAKVLYNDMFEMGNGLHRLKGCIKVKFGGVEIEDNNISGFDVTKYPDVFKTYNRRNGNSQFYGYEATVHGWNSIDCAKGKMILEVDQTDKVYIQKANQYLSDLHKVSTVYVLHFKDAAQRAEVFAKTGLNDVFITKYSTISQAVKDTIVRNVAGKVTSVKKDTTIRNVKFIKNAASNRYDRYYYLHDLPNTDIDMTAGGIYIETDKRDVKSKFSLDSIHNLITNIAKVEKVDVNVYFIGQNLMNGKLMQQGKWIKFEDYLKTVSDKVLVKNAELGMKLAMDKVKDLDTKFKFSETLLALLKKNTFSVELTKLVALMKQDDSDEKMIVKNFVNASDVDIKAIKDLYAAVFKQFPMLPIIDCALSYNGGPVDQTKIVLEYMKEKA